MPAQAIMGGQNVRHQRGSLPSLSFPLAIGPPLWIRLEAEARALKERDFWAVWIPPCHKGASGPRSDGYDAYDLFELAVFGSRILGLRARRFAHRVSTQLLLARLEEVLAPPVVRSIWKTLKSLIRPLSAAMPMVVGRAVPTRSVG